MWADLRRVLALWRPQRGALLLGLLVVAGSALAGLSLLALAGIGVAAGASLALMWLRPMVLLRPAMRWAERMTT
ncbi:MAG TPA: hypothetical protein VEY31_12905, partial [Roseococcus sp.]|nr:hypothetical protein [Roseococcus sp.]